MFQLAAAAAVLLLKLLILVVQLGGGKSGSSHVLQEPPGDSAAKLAGVSGKPLSVEPFQPRGVPVANAAVELGKLPLLAKRVGHAAICRRSLDLRGRQRQRTESLA